MMIDESKIVAAVQQWIDVFIMEYQLGLFNHAELTNQAVRMVVSAAQTEEELLLDLQQELELLNVDTQLSTSLVIHPKILHDFHLANQFSVYADSLLQEMSLVDDYHIEVFHPEFQFIECEPSAVANYCYRSPFPLLQIVRTDNVKPEQLAEQKLKNMGLMEELGEEHIKTLLQQTTALAYKQAS